MIPNAAEWRRLKSDLSPSERGHHIANRLLKRFEQAKPAIDVELIARGLGVEMREVDDPGWSGAVQSSETEAIIWVDRTDHAVRRRFTIAHELGHLFLHPLGSEFRDVSFTGSPKESEANEFAVITTKHSPPTHPHEKTAFPKYSEGRPSSKCCWNLYV